MSDKWTGLIMVIIFGTLFVNIFIINMVIRESGERDYIGLWGSMIIFNMYLIAWDPKAKGKK